MIFPNGYTIDLPGSLGNEPGAQNHEVADNAPEEAFVTRVRDVVQFKTGPDMLQIGRFSDPPVLEDLAPLTVDRTDVDLRACRVGDCDVRLPADVIGRFQREVDWHARDADARASALFKQVLLDNVRAYVSGSASGRITEYDDGRLPIRPGWRTESNGGRERRRAERNDQGPQSKRQRSAGPQFALTRISAGGP